MSARSAVVTLLAVVAALLPAVPAQASNQVSGAGPRIDAVGAENQYADVIAQVGGAYVRVSSIMKNPDTDPHTFESSPSVAQEVAQARLVVQNGLGYDGFMDGIEAASTNPSRRVIVVQHLLHLPDSTPNPHLWYKPSAMPAVAAAVARVLSSMDPAHAAYFTTRRRAFDASLAPWRTAIAQFRRQYRGVPVATTEPVADYLLAAMGIRNRTPFTLQADVMNGVDPSPQDIALEESLLSQRKVRAFVYNEQVVDSLTESFRSDARRAGVPVVGVYETMPLGFHYQQWMEAEVRAIRRAVADGTSTGSL